VVQSVPNEPQSTGGSRWGSAARTDGGASRTGVRDEPTVSSSVDRPLAGIAAVTLLAVAIGVLAKRPPLLLVGALTGAYVAYLNQERVPPFTAGVKSDTPRHKPRSTLIQGILSDFLLSFEE